MTDQPAADIVEAQAGARPGRDRAGVVEDGETQALAVLLALDRRRTLRRLGSWLLVAGVVLAGAAARRPAAAARP